MLKKKVTLAIVVLFAIALCGVALVIAEEETVPASGGLNLTIDTEYVPDPATPDEGDEPPPTEPAIEPPPPAGALTVALSETSQFTPSLWSEMFSPADNWSFANGDFNNDGKTDIAALSTADGGWRVGLSKGNTFEFKYWGALPAGTQYGVWTHLVGDYNADGYDDILSISGANGTYYTNFGKGDRFVYVAGTTVFTQPSIWRHMVLDANGDGLDELFSLDTVTRVWRRNAVNTVTGVIDTYAANSGSFSPPGETEPLVGDFNADGKKDVAEYRLVGNQWMVSLGTANYPVSATWYSTVALPPTNELSHFTGDFNGDGRSDIAIFHYKTGDYYVGLSNGAGFITSRWLSGLGSYRETVNTVGDFNGDGRSDIASYNPWDTRWQVHISEGDKFVSATWAYGVPRPDGANAFSGDFDGNGKADVAWFKSDTFVTDVLPPVLPSVVSTQPANADGCPSPTPESLNCFFETETLAGDGAFDDIEVTPGERLFVRWDLCTNPQYPAWWRVPHVMLDTTHMASRSEYITYRNPTRLDFEIKSGYQDDDVLYVKVCRKKLNLVALSPFLEDNGSAKFRYKVEGSSSTKATVSVYLANYSTNPADTKVQRVLLGSCPVDWSPGEHDCPIDKAKLQKNEGKFTHLLTYINETQVAESVTDDNRNWFKLTNIAAPTPRIFANGNIELPGPGIREVPLKYSYYYATGPRLEDRIGGPIHEIMATFDGVDAGTKQIPYKCITPNEPSKCLPPVPPGAKYIVGIADSESILLESNESDNSASVRIPDIKIKSFEWAKTNGLRIVISVTGAAPEGTGMPIAFYSGREGGEIYKDYRPSEDALPVPLRNKEDTPIVANGAVVLAAFGDYAGFPEGTAQRTVYASVNFNGAVPEVNRDNNTRELLGAFRLTQKKPEPFTLSPDKWADLNPTDVWSLRANYTADDGLQISRLKFSDRMMARSFTVPYFKLSFSENGILLRRDVYGELKLDGDEKQMRSRLVAVRARRELGLDGVITNKDPYVFQATYAIDRLSPRSRSYLLITQEYEFYPADDGTLASPSGPKDWVRDFLFASIPAARYYPKVRYEFFAKDNDRLVSIKIPQRLDYQLHNGGANTGGFYHDHNVTTNPPAMHVHGEPESQELIQDAIINGKAGEADNLHISDIAQQELPDLGMACARCLHMHWRWGDWANFPPGSEGRPIIPRDSMQSVTVGLTRYRKGEEDPFEWTSLVGGPGSLRTPENIVQKDLVFWYEGEGHAASDKFFEHGGFVKKLDPAYPEFDPLPIERQAAQLDSNGDRVKVKQLSYQLEVGASVVLPILADDEDADPAEVNVRILRDVSGALRWSGGVLTYTAKATTPANDTVEFRAIDPEDPFRHFIVNVTVKSALAAPSSLRVSETGNTSVRLVWQDNSTTEDHYVVERSANNSTWVFQEDVPKVTSGNGTALIENLARYTNHYFRVRGANAARQMGAASDSVLVNLQSPIPAPPSGLVLGQNGKTSVRIRWTDNSSNEAKFVVQQSRDNVSWADKEDVPPNPIDGALITGLTANTVYYYRVMAANADDKRSTPTTPALQVRTLNDVPAAPTNLAASEIATTSLRLKWKDNSTDEANFVVQISTNNSTWSDKENVPANPVNGAKIEGLAPYTVYYFRVRAVGTSAKRSDPSNVVQVRTLR